MSLHSDSNASSHGTPSPTTGYDPEAAFLNTMCDGSPGTIGIDQDTGSTPSKHNKVNDDDECIPMIQDTLASKEVIEHEDEKEDDGEERFELEHDIFSLMFVSPLFSFAFMFGLFVMILQCTILIMVLLDFYVDDVEADGNFFNVEPIINTNQFIAQFLALVMAIMMSNDITSSLTSFSVVFDHGIEKKIPGASKQKWLLVNLLRSCVGCIGLIVAFYFIVTSVRVLDIFQNFAAVQFVSELDNIGFFLADNSLIGMDLQKEIGLVKDTRMRYHRSVYPGSSNKWRERAPSLVLGFLFLVIFAVWIPLFSNQMNGYFFEAECGQFEVHFPDLTYDYYRSFCIERDNEEECKDNQWKSKLEQYPIYFKSFDGIYKHTLREGGGVEMVNRRPVYRQFLDVYESDETTLVGEISYCESINAWVFRIEGVRKGVNAHDCSWLLKARSDDSDPAHTLDLVEENDWEVWTGVIQEGNVDITCVECNPKEETGYECNFNGVCNAEEECECKNHWMGPRCDRCSSCVTASLTGSSLLSEKFTDDSYMVRLDYDDGKGPVNVYGRPVYYHGKLGEDGEYALSEPLIVLAYCGYHYWIREFDTAWEGFDQKSGLISYFESFHSTWDYLGPETELYYSKTIPNAFSTEPKVAWYDPQSLKEDWEWGGEDIVFKCLEEEDQERCGDLITVD